MRRVLMCVLCFLPPSDAFSQQHLVDSITQLLKQPMADTNRAITMMRLALDYEVLDTAKAYAAYKDAIAFASERQLYFQLGRIYHNQSYLFGIGAKYEEAIASIDKAISFYQMVNTTKARKQEANAYGEKGNYFRSKNDLNRSAEFHLKSIALLEQIGMESELPIRYCNMSMLFGDIGELEKQREYAHKALESAKRGGSKVHTQMAFTILAYSYSMRDENQLAKAYLDSAKISFNEYSNVDFIVVYYLVAAQVHRNLDQLDSSFYYFDRCLEASKRYNYGHGKAESQVEMGEISLLRKQYGDAEKYLLAGIKEAEAINSFDILDDAYRNLADMYAATGRYELAYVFFQKYKSANDSIVNMESKRNVAELERKYDTEKKGKQILLQQTQLQKGKILNFILLGSATTVLVIFVLSYRNYRQKRKLQQQRIAELETEKQLSATEAVLKGEEQERSRLAKDLHDGLGGMLSGIKYSLNAMKGNLIMTPDNHQAFERSMDMLDSSIQEMRRVAHNMMPEALVRFGLDTALKDYCNDLNQGGALQINYQSIGLADDNPDQTTAINIYRIVQELIGNTLKHAASTAAIVQVTKTGRLLAVTVEDDGKGFDTTDLERSKGMGWTNIRHRVDFLKGKLDIRSAPGGGTSVHIEFMI